MNSLWRVAPLLGGAFLASGFAQTGPSGRWEGSAQAPDRELPIEVNLVKDDKGAWIGTFSSTSPNVHNLPLADIKVNDKSVKFRLSGPPNAPDFDCSLENPNSMRCTFTTPGGSVPAALKRTGEGKVEFPKASPAVSADLEGNWEGSLDAPNGTLRIVVHFKNEGKTVLATLDSPDQGAMDLPVTDVVQNGSTVEFQLRLVGGGFKGNLSKENQLAGEWSQGGGSLPLTLKKSAAK